LQIPDWCGCSTEYLPVPEANGWWRLIPIWEPRRHRIRYAAGSPPVPYWQPTLARSHERPTPLTSMPPERLPDLPRVVVARIEGRDTLYEFDLTAAPSPAWRAVFLRLPPALTTAAHTPDIGRVAVHGRTVHFRAAPQHRGDWLRRIDRWIAYANSIVEE
jgi:hypothetical protein